MADNVAGDLGYTESLLERIAHAVEKLAAHHIGDTFEPAKPSTALAPSSTETTAAANTEKGV